jgi:glycerol kinase
VTNQRETVVTWHRATGEPAARAIVWQDRRTAALCEEISRGSDVQAVTRATGLPIDPYFSATKLTWLLREDRELRERADAVVIGAGTVDSWLVYKLTGGRRHVTDFTNASRTLLFNIRKVDGTTASATSSRCHG